MRGEVAALAIAALAASIALASVFVYSPLSIGVEAQKPVIVFEPGSNAGNPDLNGTTILVSVGANDTSATITIHPTYQVTYYENITLIRNKDSSHAYQVTLRVNQPLSLPPGSRATLYIYSKGASRSLTGWSTDELAPAQGTFIAALNLTSTGETSFTLNGGETVEADILVYIPEGVQLPAPSTASVYLIYSPESGAPAP